MYLLLLLSDINFTFGLSQMIGGSVCFYLVLCFEVGVYSYERMSDYMLHFHSWKWDDLFLFICLIFKILETGEVDYQGFPLRSPNVFLLNTSRWEPNITDCCYLIFLIDVNDNLSKIFCGFGSKLSFTHDLWEDAYVLDILSHRVSSPF